MNNDYYSMDKLIEFGMSMAIANQMVASMNQSLNQAQVPGAGNHFQNKGNDVYFAVIDGAKSGPYSLAEIANLISQKKIVKETYLWKPGMPQWDLAQNMEEVLRLVAINPPPIPRDQ